MVKIGLIGCGKWGLNHTRVLSQINCDFVGIADTNPETKKVAKKYGIDYEKNYEDLLPRIDSISICTPTDTHYNITKQCLLKGKHVLVEKPFTLNSQKAKELIELAKKKKLKLAVGHLFRFNPAVIKLKKNNLQDIHYITMRYIHSHKKPRKDCGSIFNFGSHLFDILNFILKIQPKSIFCKKVNYFSNELEDSAIVLLDYGGFFASLEMGWLHPLKKRDMWIIGKRNIYIDFLEQSINDIKLPWKEPLEEEMKHFCDCVDNDKKPINDGIWGYLTARQCEAALKSTITGKEIIL